MIGKRSVRVGDLITHEVSLIVEKELRDPRLGFITVTGTEVTPDLRHAKIYVSILGDENRVKENFKVLKKAECYVRHLIGERIRLKFVPEVTFCLDPSLREGAKIDRLLKEIQEEGYSS